MLLYFQINGLLKTRFFFFDSQKLTSNSCHIVNLQYDNFIYIYICFKVKWTKIIILNKHSKRNTTSLCVFCNIYSYAKLFNFSCDRVSTCSWVLYYLYIYLYIHVLLYSSINTFLKLGGSRIVSSSNFIKFKQLSLAYIDESQTVRIADCIISTMFYYALMKLQPKCIPIHDKR